MSEHLTADFQLMAATWVADREGVDRFSSEGLEPVGSSAVTTANLGLGRDAAMAQWTNEDLTWFVGRRNPVAVGTQALAHLVANPATRMKGEDLAAGIHLAAADDAKAREMVAGAFGWIGRDCYERQLPLPF